MTLLGNTSLAPGGGLSIRDFLAVLASLKEEVVRSDVVEFRATIPTSGAVTQPSVEKLREDYKYLLTEVRVGCTVATDVDDQDQIRFNIMRSDTRVSLFTSDIEITPMVAQGSGRTIPMRFLIGTLISPGTTLAPKFTRRVSTVTTQRIVTVKLSFDLIPLRAF